jgi:acyl carrier protein
MTTETNAATFVTSFLSEFGPIPGATEVERLACDYIQCGLLDSFGMFTLISRIESTFGITFTSQDLEAPEFKTVGGLIATIERRRATSHAGGSST